MKQLTKEEAISIAEYGLHEKLNSREIVELQLFQDKLCMPFGAFHKAIEKELGRGVFTHEFANTKRLIEEFKGIINTPSFSETLDVFSGK